MLEFLGIDKLKIVSWLSLWLCGIHLKDKF